MKKENFNNNDVTIGVGDQKQKIEPLPYQRWAKVLTTLYRQTVDKHQFMRALKLGGLNVKGVNVTPIDFFSMAGGLSDKELLESVSAYLEVDDVRERIEEVDRSLQASKEYIENYLLRRLPKEIVKLQIKGTNDLLKIFKKTTTLRKKGSLGFAPAYCELLKAMVGNFMFEQKDLQYLLKETRYLYENLFRPGEEGEQALHLVRRLPDGYDEIVAVSLEKMFLTSRESLGVTRAVSYYRGKSRNSFVTKFLLKPELTVEEAIKDGLGLKFEANSKEELKFLLEIVLRELFLRFVSSPVKIKNTSLFKEEEINILKENLSLFSQEMYDLLQDRDLLAGLTLSKGSDLMTLSDRENPYSDINYKDVKISGGQVRLPKRGEEGALLVSRPLEVQFVLSGNSNEDKFSNHNIYEAKKKLAVTTRNLGSFTEDYLDIVVQEAAIRSGLGFDTIKEHFLQTILAKVVLPKKQLPRFVVKKRVLELMKTGLFYQGVDLY